MNIMKMVTRGVFNEKNMSQKEVYFILIQEKYRGGGASIIKKNDRILVNTVGVLKQKETSPSFSGCNLVEHPIITHGMTVIKQQCLSKVLVDELVGFPRHLLEILRRQRRNPGSKWIWRWLNGLLYQKNPWFGDRKTKSEIEALEILQTWQHQELMKQLEITTPQQRPSRKKDTMA